MDIERVFVKEDAVLIMGDVEKISITLKRNNRWYVVGIEDDCYIVERQDIKFKMLKDKFHKYFELRPR